MPIVILHNVIFGLGFYETAYSWKEYLVQIVRTLLFSIGETEPFLPQLWFIKSLFFAEIFYALIVVIARRNKIEKWLIILPLGLAVFAFNPKFFPHYMFHNIMLPLRGCFYFALAKQVLSMNKLEKLRYKIVLWIISMVGMTVWYYFSFNHWGSITGIYGWPVLLQIFMLCSFSYIGWNVCSYVSSIAVIRDPLTYIGRNTLPIYFLHYAAMAVCIRMLGELSWCTSAIIGIVFSLTIYYIVIFIYRPMKSICKI